MRENALNRRLWFVDGRYLTGSDVLSEEEGMVMMTKRDYDVVKKDLGAGNIDPLH